jgi:hypothetical protein
MSRCLVPALVRSLGTHTPCSQEIIARQLSSQAASVSATSPASTADGGSLLRIASDLKLRGVILDPGFIGSAAALEQRDANAAFVKGFQQSQLPLRNYLQNAIDFRGPYRQWMGVRRPPYLTQAHKRIAFSIWSSRREEGAAERLERDAIWELCSGGGQEAAFATKTQFRNALVDLCDAGLVKTFAGPKKNAKYVYGLTSLGSQYVEAISAAH